jgi:hypothetical protein
MSMPIDTMSMRIDYAMSFDNAISFDNTMSFGNSMSFDNTMSMTIPFSGDGDTKISVPIFAMSMPPCDATFTCPEAGTCDWGGGGRSRMEERFVNATPFHQLTRPPTPLLSPRAELGIAIRSILTSQSKVAVAQRRSLMQLFRLASPKAATFMKAVRIRPDPTTGSLSLVTTQQLLG